MKTKRFLATLLILTMIISLLSAFALTASAASVAESGDCGLNDPYVLYSDGTLELLGWGDIDANAFKGRTDIKKVIIGEKVQKIGSEAFKDCTNLASVSIAYNSSGMEIGENAFENTAITAVDIPSSVRKIKYGAFKNCTNLEIVNYYGVPDTNHDANAFTGCTKLTSANVQPYYTSAKFCGLSAVGGTIKPTSSTIAEAVWGADENSLNNSGTFEEAISAATAENSTVKYIKLQTDLFPVYETSSTIQGYYDISSGKFTIDLNGNDIFFSNNGYTFYIYNSDTEVTFIDTAKIDGTVYAAYNFGFSPINIKKGATVIFRGGNFEGGNAMSIYTSNNETEQCKVIVYDGNFKSNSYFNEVACIKNQGGDFTAYGGIFTAYKRNVYTDASSKVATATINGGTFSSKDNSVFYVNTSKLDLSNYTNVNNITVSTGLSTPLVPSEDTIILPDGYGFSNNNKFYDELEKGIIYSINEIPENVYSITTTATNGSVSTNFDTAEFETEVTLTYTPDENCEFVSVSVTDIYGNQITVKNNKFIMPASDVTVNAVFGDKDKVHTITCDATYGECETISIPTTEEGVLASALPIPSAKDTIEQGYWFKGWYDAQTGGNEISDTTVFVDDTTIYAQWDIVKPEIISWNTEVVHFTWAKSDTTPMIILADYSGNKLENIIIMDYAKVSKTKIGETVSWGTTEIKLDKGDKIMMWENFTTCKPLCEAYIVTGDEKFDYGDDNPGIDLPTDKK